MRKLPNKEAKASADAAERRAQTKENDAQLNTEPTQSGAPVSQGLGGVRRTAQARKQERFTALMHHLMGFAGGLHLLSGHFRPIEFRN